METWRLALYGGQRSLSISAAIAQYCIAKLAEIFSKTVRLSCADIHHYYGSLKLLRAATANTHAAMQRAVSSAVLAAGASLPTSLRLGPQLPLTANKPPELSPEVWHVVARATLAACDDSLGAWLRLSMVSRDWRLALKGSAAYYLLILLRS